MERGIVEGRPAVYVNNESSQDLVWSHPASHVNICHWSARLEPEGPLPLSVEKIIRCDGGG